MLASGELRIHLRPLVVSLLPYLYDSVGKRSDNDIEVLPALIAHSFTPTSRHALESPGLALVIEDHHLMRLALIEELKTSIPEAIIFGAKDLTTALELLADQNYDLVLIDPGLPGYDSSSASERLGVVKRLVDASPGALHLVVSGAFTEEDWPRYARIGVLGYLAKTRVVPGSIAAALKIIQTDGTCVLPPEYSSTPPDFHYARLTQREQEALDWVRQRSKTSSSDALFEELAEKNGIDPTSAQKFYKRARSKLRKRSAPKDYW